MFTHDVKLQVITFVCLFVILIVLLQVLIKTLFLQKWGRQAKATLLMRSRRVQRYQAAFPVVPH